MKIFIKTIAILLATIFMSALKAQDVKWIVKEAGTTTYREAGDANNVLIVDRNKNIYTAPFISDTTVSFNGSCTINNIARISGGISGFCKMDSNQSCLVSKFIGDSLTLVRGLNVDASSNIYISGAVFGTQPLCSSVHVSTLSAFVSKYNSSGSCTWYATASVVSGGLVESLTSQIDNSGNVYIAGAFQGTAAFGSTNITSQGLLDGFVAKYNNSGSLLWVKDFGGAKNDMAIGISNIANGVLYITGQFDSTAHFGSYTLAHGDSMDVFIAKMDTNGNFLWVQSGGSSADNESGTRVQQDQWGNVFLAGTADSGAVFGTFVSNRKGEFLARYNSSGQIQWLQMLGTEQSQGNAFTSNNGDMPSIAIYDSCLLYAGSYNGTFSIGSFSVTNNTNQGIVVGRFDYNGNPLWLGSYGVSGNLNSGSAITVDSVGAMYVSGLFTNTINFGGKTINANSSLSANVFITKIVPPLVITQVAGGLNMVCRGSSFNVNFSVDSARNSGNVFGVQLSDTSGNFGSPVTIGTDTATTSGTISCVIPGTVSPGLNYRLRVVASNPSLTGEVFVSTLRISADTPALPTLVTPSSATGVCIGQSANISAVSANNNIYWYTQDTGGVAIAWSASGANCSIVPNGTVTYYAQAEDGCVNPTRVATGAITLDSLPANPANPTSNSPQCSNVGVILTRSGTPPSGQSWYWQSTAGGTLTVDSNSADTVTTSGTYYIYALNSSTGCWSSGGGSLAVTVNSLPSAPTSVGPPVAISICTGTSINLNATAPGDTIYWYTASGGGSTIGSSLSAANFLVTPSSTITYYAQSKSTAGCFSSTRTATGLITVDTLPVNPGNPTSNSPQCSSVILTRSGTVPAGLTWYWQTTPTGTSATNSSSTNTVTSSGTYYIRAQYTSAPFCWSSGAGSLAVTVNPLPSAPTSVTPSSATSICNSTSINLNATAPGDTIYWYTASGGGSPIGFSLSGANFSVTPASTITYYAQSKSTAGCTSPTRTATGVITVNSLPSNPGNPSSNSPQCANAGVTLTRTGTPPAGTTWNWETASNGTSTTDTGATYNASSTGTYYIRSRNNSSSCWSSGTGSLAVTVNPLPSNPGNPTSNSPQCATPGVTLTRSGTPAAGTKWNWETSSSGTSTTDTGATYNVSSSATYYSRAQNSSTLCWSSGAGSLAVTVNPLPSNPGNPTSNSPECADAGVTLTRTGTPTAGETWYWQTSLSGTSTTDTGAAYIISSSGTYYIRSRNNTTSCWSSGAGSLAVTVNSLPSNPGNPTSNSPQCADAGVTLTATGSAPSGQTWYWQTSSSGTITAHSGNTYNVSTSGTYYINAQNNSTGCWSSGAGSLAVTVDTLPATPPNPTSNSPQCVGIGVTLTASGSPPSGQTWYWQTSPTGTSTAHSGSTYNVGTSGTYYINAQSNSAGCWSSGAGSLAVIVNAVPNTPTGTGNQSICSNGSNTFTFYDTAHGSNGNEIEWATNSSFTGSHILISPATINITVSPGADSTLWVRSRDSVSGCTSAAVTVNAEVNLLPNVTITPNDTLVNLGQYVLFTAIGGVYYYWPFLDAQTSSILENPFIDTAYYIVYATDSAGCTNEATSRGRALSPVHKKSAVIDSVSVEGNIVLTCTRDTFQMQVANDSSQLLPLGILLQFSVPTDSFKMIFDTGFTYSILSDSTVLIKTIDSLHPNIPTNITYSIYVPCNYIDSSEYSEKISITNTSGGAYSGTFNINGDTSASPYRIIFSGSYFHAPSIFYSNNGEYLNRDTLSIPVGQSQSVTTWYSNGGLEALNGEIEIYDGLSCSPEYVKIDSVIVTVGNNAPLIYLPDSFPIIINPINIPKHGLGDSVSVREVFTVLSCLPGYCTDTLSIYYGCSGNPCQMISPSRLITIKKSVAEPVLSIQRINPAPVPASESDQYAWDASCINSETLWEFLIANLDTIGGAIAHDVTINLSNGHLESYTFIRQDSVQVIYNDPRFPNNPVPSPGIVTVTNLAAGDFSPYVPACYDSFVASGDTPVKGFIVDSINLLPQQKVVLRFKTYRCCPSDNPWNSGVYFNWWQVQANCYDDCGTSKSANPGNGVYYDSTNHETINTYLPYVQDIANPIAISTDQYDGGPNLFLGQNFQQQVIDISGVKDGCGTPDTFQITNLLFTGNHANVSDYGTQLFCDSAIPYPQAGAGVTGTNPRGQFKVSIVCDSGVDVYPGTPVIIGGGVVWRADSAWAKSDTTWTAIFDIDSLVDSTNSALFRNFFLNSSFNFLLQGCCPSPNPNPQVNVYTWFNPAIYGKSCVTCWIPLSSINFSLQLHCPGCVTPGMIIDNFQLQRSDSSLGFADANNDRLPEASGGALIPITSSYTEFSQLKFKNSIVGDKLNGIVTAHFEPGDSTDGGFNYGQWQSYWGSHSWSGGTTPVLTQWYLEQTIDSASLVGLNLTSASLEYRSASGGAPIYYTFTVLPSPSMVSGEMRYVFHATAHDIGSGVTFAEKDSFILSEGFSICTNPPYNMPLTVNNEMFLSLADLDSSAPYETYPEVGQVYSENDSSGTGPQDFNPATEALFLCSTFAGLNNVYTIDTGYSEIVDNTNTCYKTIALTVSYKIDGDNVFPYEYRLMPGIHASNTANGPTLLYGNPVTFHFTVPDNYTASVYSTYTDAPTWAGFDNTYNGILQTVDTVSNTIHGGGTIIYGYNASYYYVDTARAIYTPPFENSAYNSDISGLNISPVSSPVPSQYNVIVGGKPALVIGDEIFQQTMVFSLTPVCATSTGNSTLIPDTFNYGIIPAYDSACNGTMNDVALGNNVTDSLTIPRPSIVINQQNSIYDSSYIDCPMNFTIGPDVNNMILFMDVPANLETEGLQLVCVSSGAACSGTVYPDTVIVGSGDTFYNRYFITNLTSSESTDFYFRFRLTNCDLAGQTVTIPLYYAWSCQNRFVPEDTVPPSPNPCDTTKEKNISIFIPSFKLEQSQSPLHATTFQTCKYYTLEACMTNGLPGVSGGLGNFIDSLYLPENVVLNPTGVQITYNYNTYTVPFDSITHTVLGLDTLWAVNLTNFTSFTDSSLFGDSGLVSANPTSFCIKFPVRLDCHATTIDSIIDVLHMTLYCSQDTDAVYVFGPITPSTTGGNCGLTISASELPGCHLPVVYSYGTLPFDSLSGFPFGAPSGTITWSFNPTDTAEHADTLTYSSASSSHDTIYLPPLSPAGIETVTIIDSNGCVYKDTFSVDSASHITLSEAYTHSECYASSYASIDVTAHGGETPYTYHWNNGSTTQNRSQLYPGAYTITVDDNNRCSAIAHDTIVADSSCCTAGRLLGQIGHPVPYSGSLSFSNVTSSQLASWLITIHAQGAPYILSLGSTTISFADTLWIDNNFSFSLCKNITFGPGAIVIVKPGDTLYILNSTLRACDDTLWRGIYVTGGTYNITPATLFLESDTIENAQYAVEAYNSYGINGYNHAQIGIINTKFINNFIGFYFNGGSSSIFGTTQPKLNELLPFTGNKFIGSQALLPVYRTMTNTITQPPVSQSKWAWAGVQLDNLSSMNIGAGSSLALNDTFYGLANGIVSRNSNLNVVNSTFYYIQDHNYNFTQNYILYEGNGIVAEGNLSPAKPYIYRSLYERGNDSANRYVNYTFYQCTRGIVADKMNDDIRYNNITSSVIDSQPTGIRATNSKLATINIKYNVVSAFKREIQLLDNDPVGFYAIAHNFLYVSDTGSVSDAIGIEVQETGNPPVKAGSAQIDTNEVYTYNGAITGIGITGSNGIYCTGNGVHLFDPAQSLEGILFSGCRNIRDKENVVVGASGAAQNSFNMPAGIYYYSTYGSVLFSPPFTLHFEHCYHDCNAERSIYTGIRFSGPNGSSYLRTNSFNSIVGDTLTNGLLVDSSTSIDRQIHQGNEWYGNYYQYWARNDNNLFVTEQEQFFVTDSLPYNPTNVVPGFEQWFVPSPGTETDCDSLTYSDSIASLIPTPLIHSIIDDSLQFGFYNDELVWQNGKMVYEELHYDTALLDSGTDIRQFYTLKDTSATGALVRVSLAAQKAMLPDSATASQLGVLQNTIGSLLSALIGTDSVRATLIDTTLLQDDSSTVAGLVAWIDNDIADSLFQTDTVLLDSIISFSNISNVITDTGAFNALSNQIYDADSSLAIQQESEDSLIQIYDSLRYQALVYVNDSNNAIVTSSDIESHYAESNYVYLNSLALDDSSFTGYQLASLYYFAFQCPLQGGEAVFRARAMLALVIDTFYNDDALCLGTGSERMLVITPKDTVAEPIDVKLYPNPANDYAILQLNQDVNPLLLKITDETGREIFNQPIATIGGYYVINTSSFSSGMYFINLYSNSEKLFGGKLSIFMK